MTATKAIQKFQKACKKEKSSFVPSKQKEVERLSRKKSSNKDAIFCPVARRILRHFLYTAITITLPLKYENHILSSEEQIKAFDLSQGQNIIVNTRSNYPVIYLFSKGIFS
jgi:hypothetical protein